MTQVQAWVLTDGVVLIRPTEPGDITALIAGRDMESERWLGPGTDAPDPTACVLVGGHVVGWVDFDTDQAWLGPREVNIGFCIFPDHRRHGYATRAVKLLLRRLAESTEMERAHLAIDAENSGSLGVARTVGAVEVERYRNAENRPNIRHAITIVRGPG